MSTEGQHQTDVPAMLVHDGHNGENDEETEHRAYEACARLSTQKTGLLHLPEVLEWSVWDVGTRIGLVHDGHNGENDEDTDHRAYDSCARLSTQKAGLLSLSEVLQWSVWDVDNVHINKWWMLDNVHINKYTSVCKIHVIDACMHKETSICRYTQTHVKTVYKTPLLVDQLSACCHMVTETILRMSRHNCLKHRLCTGRQSDKLQHMQICKC